MKSRKRVIEDIEETIARKRPDKALQEALTYVQSIIETIHDSLLVLDADLSVVSANDAFYKTFELTPSHTQGKLIYELCDGRWDIPEIRELLEQRLSDSTILEDIEVEQEFPNIGRRVMLLNARRMLGRGHKTQRILLAIRDITARKLAEQALQKAESRLDIKNRIADIFLTVPVDEIYGEVLQVILKAMASRYGVFGYIDELDNLVVPSMTRDIWQKCKVQDKTIVYPPENWGGIWGRALKEKKILYANRGLHVPKGHIPVARVLVVPILYSGELIGLLQVANKWTAYDDEDKSYLETLAKYIAPILNARLERDKREKERKELDRLKDEFIGMVSHEFSRPLTVITGCLNTVLDEATDLSEQERTHLLQNAALEAEALTHLLGNLLELARVQAERLILHPEPIEARVVAKNVVERIAEQYPTHKYSLDFPAEIPPVEADPVRLERVLYNLLDNARKYSPKGSEVKVFAKQDKDNLIIGVSDQGMGIATTDQERIFGAFERLEQSGFKQTKGIGLGLLVCRRLVEAHGGQIGVESVPDEGSTFLFTLPCKREV